MRIAILLSLGASWACTTPCESLRSRAESCETVRSRYVPVDDSVCASTRAEVGEPKFDAFADCVLEADCSDAGAVERCEQAHLGDELTACTEFRAWGSACGLEPVGTDDECQGAIGNVVNLSDTGFLESLPEPVREQLPPEFFEQDSVVFSDWVTCVTADGCPEDNDPRYDECKNEVVAPQLTMLLDACVKIEAWSEMCAGAGPSVFPVEETSIPECLVEAQPFTPESYLAYANCLEMQDCDSFSSRLSCLVDNLELTMREDLEPQCQRLLDYSDSCTQIDLGGGSLQGCFQIFSRFTEDSFAQYVDCIEILPCDEALAGSVQCSMVLDLQ